MNFIKKWRDKNEVLGDCLSISRGCILRLKTEDDTLELSETCFLPTKKTAEQYIENELSIQYVPVRIDLETLKKNGIWSYTRGRVERWDKDFE